MNKESKEVKYYRDQLNRFYKDMSELQDQIWKFQRLLVIKEIKDQLEIKATAKSKLQTLKQWLDYQEDLISQ